MQQPKCYGLIMFLSPQKPKLIMEHEYTLIDTVSENFAMNSSSLNCAIYDFCYI